MVDGGKFVAVGTREKIEPLIDLDTEVIDAGGRAVLPGFVDAHTHPVFGGNRVDEFVMRSEGATYEEIAGAGGGIRSTVAKTRAASFDELLRAGKRHARWFLEGGTTTIEAKSGYGLSLESELKILRVIRELGRQTPLNYVPTFLGAHAVPEEFGGDADRCLACLAEEILPAVTEEGLAEYCDAFCEAGYFGADQVRSLFKKAKAMGLGLRLHADQLTCCGGAKLAAEMGAVTADHLEHAGPAEIGALKEARVQPVLLPGSVYALGKTRYPPAREMIDRGLAAVLATDFNPGSSPTTSMPMVMSLACTQMKMTPAEALTACTVNAAHSLARGNRIGSIEPGKNADFVVHDCDDYREIAYFFGVHHAREVFVNGEIYCP